MYAWIVNASAGLVPFIGDMLLDFGGDDTAVAMTALQILLILTRMMKEDFKLFWNDSFTQLLWLRDRKNLWV